RAPLRNLPRVHAKQRRFGARNEVLDITPFGGSGIVGKLPSRAIELAVADVRRSEPLACTPASIVTRNHVRPDRRGQRTTGGAGHDGLRLVESEPDTGDERRRD